MQTQQLNSKDMESILVATDFSVNATHAAEYGYALASQIKANLVLCNAFIAREPVPDITVSVWPAYDYDDLRNDSNDDLKELERSLVKKQKKGQFEPSIYRISEAGPTHEVITDAAKKEHAGLVVLGTHGHNGISGFIIGDHAQRMIDETTCPLLLVPPTAQPGSIKKVAFATDFKNPESDLKAIFRLIPMFKKLRAELLITHIYNEAHGAFNFKMHIEGFLLELSNKANYPHIYYRIVKSDSPEKGLDWLCRFGQVDILAMVHREKSFFSGLINGSHTKKMANHVSVPLLVIPEK